MTVWPRPETGQVKNMTGKFEIVLRLEHSSETEAKAIHEFGKAWPLFRDFGLTLISHTTCKEMQEDGELPISDWNTIKQGFALIAMEGVRKYSTTFDKLLQGLCDFQSGWLAAKRHFAPTIEVKVFGYGKHEITWSAGYKAKKRIKISR